MTIPTQMSLHGFIVTAPELTYGKSDVARFRARVGVEQWRKEADGSFTKLDPQFCEMVMFKSAAERAYARLRAGDHFVASGYVHEYEFDRDGEAVQREEFVARRIGHDTARTRYSVERPATERATGPESGRDAQRTVEHSSTAVGI
ncbi:single-stranded DNA-binding protein [Aeromicrobium piscarium]|uniref:Single-stranded DNA-binding protein n=1 Tax=Aeromicrobium piscarium TaxID=2590901 RepID=A0A554SHC7_9ACTN|nr:single-stranded DNA-binding protein [Aeromicrobium piscarium]TSD65742.1 single-stranded DNA-binding protein [Aeromicrobium piscarium]